VKLITAVLVALLIAVLIASMPRGIEGQAKTGSRIGLLVYGYPPPAPSPE